MTVYSTLEWAEPDNRRDSLLVIVLIRATAETGQERLRKLKLEDCDGEYGLRAIESKRDLP